MVYQNVVKYCADNNISIAEFEKMCGLGNGTVGKWNKGKNPSLNTLYIMQSKTGISLENWVSDDDIVGSGTENV